MVFIKPRMEEMGNVKQVASRKVMHKSQRQFSKRSLHNIKNTHKTVRRIWSSGTGWRNKQVAMSDAGIIGLIKCY